MRDLKLVSSLIYVTAGFAIFYGLYNYVFDKDFGFWAYLFPVGSSIFHLIGKYADMASRKENKGFIILKDSPVKFPDFNGVFLSALIIFYVRENFLLWISPLLLVDLLLIYLIKKRQIYDFGELGIKNLSSTGKNIPMRDIVSIELLANSVEVVYKNIEFDEEDDDEDEDEEPFLTFELHRRQLEKPHSWEAFKSIIEDFKGFHEKHQKENLLEKATLEV